jgi:hypothetical protein
MGGELGYRPASGGGAAFVLALARADTAPGQAAPPPDEDPAPAR